MDEPTRVLARIGLGVASWRVLAAALALILAGMPGGVAAQATDDRACLACHDEPEFLRSQVATVAQARSLHVPPGPLGTSGHAEITCAECHQSFERFPHPVAAETLTCATASCHTSEPHPEWEGSVHARVQEDDGLPAADCAECHGIHDVAWAEDLRIEGGPAQRRMNADCVSCHYEQAYTPADPHGDSTSCWGCHAPHATAEVTEPEAWVSPQNQLVTCAACHQEAADSLATDVHGHALVDQARAQLHAWPPSPSDSIAPSCSDCHGAHPMPGVDREDFQVGMVERCATCHTHDAETYYYTYHGKATRLGSGVSASCAQCHTAHSVLPSDSIRSSVHADALIGTCGECHEQARAGFVLYDSHPDPHDPERNAVLYYSLIFMHALLIGTLGVFGLHTVLWWIRIWIDSRKGAAGADAPGGSHG